MSRIDEITERIRKAIIGRKIKITDNEHTFGNVYYVPDNNIDEFVEQSYEDIAFLLSEIDRLSLAIEVKNMDYAALEESYINSEMNLGTMDEIIKEQEAENKALIREMKSKYINHIKCCKKL